MFEKSLDFSEGMDDTEGMSKSTKPQTAAEKKAIMANYYNVSKVLVADKPTTTLNNQAITEWLQASDEAVGLA